MLIMIFLKSNFSDVSFIDFKKILLNLETNDHIFMKYYFKNDLSVKLYLVCTKSNCLGIYSFYQGSKLSDFIDFCFLCTYQKKKT